MLDPTDYLRIALDPIRLAVLGAAAAGAVEADQLAEKLGVQPREVLLAVVKLQEAGLLDEERCLDREVLREIGARLPGLDPADESVVEGPWSADEAAILQRFVRGTRLTRIPAQRAKRLVVLDRLAQEFEPGVRYSERDVNLALQVWHPDYAALRRYLVDEGFLTRAEGVYWRTGGRFPDDGMRQPE